MSMRVTCLCSCDSMAQLMIVMTLIVKKYLIAVSETLAALLAVAVAH